ncbi:MAG TPA: HAD family hydrolase [Gemmatimonadales bacterium]|nr:HAD family hydrolase [Gemmatimonadales bacterium]
MTKAVFFDVDFTLIHPGPTFQGSGYQEFCGRRGIEVDPAAFEGAVAAAALTLDAGGGLYDPAIFISYTRRIIEGMGGKGDALDEAAKDIYDEWSECGHFTMYDEVPDVLRAIHARGLKIGLISNTQRCLTSFQTHFALDGLFTVAVSSADHGYMKPHPSIFEAALSQIGAVAEQSVMVGDSLAHDIEGARQLGMRAVLVSRTGTPTSCPPDVPVVQSLRELLPLL